MIDEVSCLHCDANLSQGKPTKEHGPCLGPSRIHRGWTWQLREEGHSKNTPSAADLTFWRIWIPERSFPGSFPSLPTHKATRCSRLWAAVILCGAVGGGVPLLPNRCIIDCLCSGPFSSPKSYLVTQSTRPVRIKRDAGVARGLSVRNSDEMEDRSYTLLVNMICSEPMARFRLKFWVPLFQG